MIKRLMDITVSAAGLIIFFPLLLPITIAVWMYDWHSPFYVAERVGRGGRLFRMVKLRSMVVNRSTVDSTAADDPRITPIGRFIRRYKIDELSQLLNVLKGDMSLVGPRPNVKRETDLYTAEEKKLLSVKPGITDLASIVFSDEGDILAGQRDPDIAYNQLIRPWKSRLGLVYVEHQNLWIDIQILALTALSILHRPAALRGVVNILSRLGAPPELKEVASRKVPLRPTPPPGSNRVVTSRN